VDDRPAPTSRRSLLHPRALRAELWVLPSTAGVVALAASALLLQVRGDPPLGWLAWPGDGASASSVLQVIASSVITVTTLALSLVVIALQLASQQFSPRLLREFAHDRVTQQVLGVLIATFVFALTTLRGITEDGPLPEVSLAIAVVLGLASMAALVAFITHIIRLLRVDTMMVAVHEGAQDALHRTYGPADDPPARPDGVAPPDPGRPVRARSSGFVRGLDVERVAAAAAAADVVVHVAVRTGDHVTQGAPVAFLSGPAGASLEEAVHAALELGYERTLERDAALGFRQLTDIAVKALSPAVNDPATAAHALGYLGDLLVDVAGLALGPSVHHDAAGVPRLVVPDRDLRYHLDVVCGLIRRFARREPVVLMALLGVLRDVAGAARDDGQRAEVLRQVDLVLDEVAPDLIAEDERSVRDMADRVRAAARGDLFAAYVDRSGETRST
jgi:uncharacterized membrane protein